MSDSSDKSIVQNVEYSATADSSNTKTSKLSGSLLVAAITSVCSSGFLLFGYDQGVMSGVVISQYWLAQMSNPSTIMISTITALYDVGAVFGAIGAAVVGDRLGRKRTLMLGCIVLIVGSVLMAACFERIQMMFGRVLTGIGIGFITSVTPVYQSEISPAAQRGWQVCCQLTTMLFGLMLAYWINYGFFYQQSSVQWRFPLAFQMVFAIYCIGVTIFLPDTPRWLLRYGSSPDEGARILARLRDKAVDHPSVQKEKNEIADAIKIESHEEGSWLDLFRDAGIAVDKRFYLALGIQFMQQMSGWMATVWCYPPEILPLKIRAKGAALAAAADFLGNFVVVEITPPALRNIGYKTYVIFAVFNIVNAMIVWAFYPETAGSTLESIDFLFTNTDELNTPKPFYHMLQWSVVYQAPEVMRQLQTKRDSLAADQTVAEA
ncbi:hypothetical protein ACLMJK_003284 [Lecanora helva]